MTLAFERGFFRLAGWWLACRLQVMGGLALNAKHQPNLAYDLLGMVDHAWEMQLVMAQELGRPVELFSRCAAATASSSAR